MKPVAQIVVSLILAFTLCQLCYGLFEKGIKKYNTHTYEKFSALFLHNSAYDVLFLGSSRTHVQIDPKIIDSICHINSYNAGVEGGNLFEFKMVLEAYLQNHPPPSYLLLTLDLNAFDLRRKFFNYSVYFPFIKNKVIKQTLNDEGHSTIPAQIFPFLILTVYDDYAKMNAIKGLRGETEIKKGQISYKGFLSNTVEEMPISDTAMPFKPEGISNTAINYLNDIMKICRKNNTSLIFTYAPEFQFQLQKHVYNAGEIFNTINEIAQQNNIPFWRHDSLDISSNIHLFSNVGHLNREGAELYSVLLAKQFKEYRTTGG